MQSLRVLSSDRTTVERDGGRSGIFIKALMLGWMVLFAGLVFLPDSFFPEKMVKDSLLITQLAGGDGWIHDASKGYVNTARLFEFLGPVTSPFLLGLGWLVFFLFVRQVRTWPVMFLALVVTFSPFILGMIRPQKEIVVALVAVAVLLLAERRQWPVWLVLAGIVVAYGAYAGVFRSYFGLIGLVFGFLLMWGHVNGCVRVMMVLGVIAGYMLVPNEVLFALQEPRDATNHLRMLVRPEATRTAFMNLYPDVDHFTFIANYVYASVRLNLPLFFDVRFSEIFMTMNLVIYGVLLRFMLVRAGTPRERILPMLFISHMVVLPLFEPDLGSYLRHISSVFLYLTPGLVLLDKYVQALPARRMTVMRVYGAAAT